MLSPNELAQLVAVAEEGLQRGLRSALATIVAVTGSSYRRPGARLLTREDGAVAGCISGGCLERDVIEKSRLAIAKGRTRLVRYDTAEEEDGGFGLGCGGEITILIEPISRDSQHLRYLKQVHSRQQPAVLVTCFGGKNAGAVALLQSGELATGGGLTRKVVENISRAAEGCLVDAQTGWQNGSDGMQLLCEYIAPAPILVMFGAGPEAVPLANCAHALGYRVTLVDERPGTIVRIRKLLPEGVNCCAEDPTSVFEKMSIAAGIACVVATHNMTYDLRAVRAAVVRRAAYIGLLGPKRRGEEIFESLRRMGCDGDAMKVIHAPVGLDIGGDTPPQIALSILAEIQAVAAGRSGGFLRDRQAAIHDQGMHAQGIDGQGVARNEHAAA